MPLARRTGVDGNGGLACAIARGEKRKALLELGFELPELLDLAAGFGESLHVRVPQLLRGDRRRARPFLLADELLDLREGEAEALELGDPAHADQRIGGEEPIAALRAFVRPEQAELLVQMEGADGLARGLGEVAHLNQLVLGCERTLVRGPRGLTQAG